MTKENPSVPKLGEVDWRQLCAQWEKSSLSQKTFCAKQNISYGTFLTWRGKILQEQRKSHLNGFASVHVASSKLSASASNPIKITLPNGVALTVFPGSDLSQVNSMLKLLGVSSC